VDKQSSAGAEETADPQGGARVPESSLPLEIAVVWLLFAIVAAAMFVTYSRLPASELYRVSHSGLAGGASRVLVFSNFSTALPAIAVLVLLSERAGGWMWAGATVVGIGLCAAVFWPGVVDEADLDAKPVNAAAALGVLIAVARSARELRVSGRPAWSGRRPGDRLRVIVAALALFLALPWLAAELGFFLNGVPVLGWLFQTGRYVRTVPGLPQFPPAVHHGHHHGLDGTILLLSALLLSRVVPSVRRHGLRAALGAYLSLMTCYGIGNIANDFWLEQVWKRHWTSWQIPDVLRPNATLAWGVIVLGGVVLYAAARWWSARESGARRERGLLPNV
jgi:hypothetical protein